MGRDKKRYEIGLVFFILVFLFFQYISLSTSASTDNSIWINKSANASSYAQEEDILYTINYGNKNNKIAYNVSVVDILTEAEILEVSPPASSMVGDNLTWVIGNLKPGESGSISLLVKHPEIPQLDFQEDSSISGEGYVNVRKKTSTISNVNNTLTNIAIIFATYRVDDTNPSQNVSLSSSVTVKLVAVPDASLRSLEHGSGYYKETLRSSLNNIRTNIKLSKDLSARHEPVTLSLPGQKTLQLSSLWSDRSTAWTDDGKTVNSVNDDYNYMKSIDKETSFDIVKSNIIYSAAGNFSGGIAQIDYDRHESVGKVPGSKEKEATYISETYHGDFEMNQSLDAYGTSPTYKKEASGAGFVSSQKVFNCNLRSGEQGSGSYRSAESIQSGAVLKNIDLAYEPSLQAAGSSNITYAGKWGEIMYARDPGKGTEIMNRFSSADYILKDAVMSPSFLSLTGGFKGTNYLKAKVADVDNTGEEALHLERLLTGGFTLDTTIALGGTSRYAYPHINLTKRVLERDDYIVTYRIWVNNDGNMTLSPVAVVDLLPPGAILISSTLKPTVQGRIVSWTLQTLPQGETTVIDLKVALADLSPSVINRVQAASRFLGNTIVAEASASPDDTIESAVEEDAYEKELKLWEETVYGPWAPPSCYNLNSSISCTCERAIDDFYNNLTADCAEIP